MSAAQHGAMALSGIAKIKQLLEEQALEEGSSAGRGGGGGAVAAAEAAAARHAWDLDPTQLAQVPLPAAPCREEGGGAAPSPEGEQRPRARRRALRRCAEWTSAWQCPPVRAAAAGRSVGSESGQRSKVLGFGSR